MNRRELLEFLRAGITYFRVRPTWIFRDAEPSVVELTPDAWSSRS